MDMLRVDRAAKNGPAESGPVFVSVGQPIAPLAFAYRPLPTDRPGPSNRTAVDTVTFVVRS